MDSIRFAGTNAEAPVPAPDERYRIELSIIGYPPAGYGAPLVDPEGQAWAKLAGPWHEQLIAGALYQDFTLPMHGNPAEQFRVSLENVRHAQPGWLAGRMRLLAATGEELGSMRPFLLYARECDIATYTYFTDTHPAVDGAFAVGIRVTREP